MIDQAAAKQALRQEMRSRRKAMPQAEKVSREQRLCRRFLESSLYADCRQLFCFVALPQEPETRELLRRRWRTEKRLPYPDVSRNGAWRFTGSPRNSPWKVSWSPAVSAWQSRWKLCR